MMGANLGRDSGRVAQIPEIWPWRRRGPEESEINDLSESEQGLGRGRPDPGNLALEAPRPRRARNQRSE